MRTILGDLKGAESLRPSQDVLLMRTNLPEYGAPRHPPLSPADYAASVRSTSLIGYPCEPN